MTPERRAEILRVVRGTGAAGIAVELLVEVDKLTWLVAQQCGNALRLTGDLEREIAVAQAIEHRAKELAEENKGQLRRAREALARYGEHDDDCAINGGCPLGEDSCNCGLDAELRALGVEP